MRWATELVRRWHEARLSRVALGKYIILMASLVHIVWAVLLFVEPAAGGSTPVSILVKTFGGPIRTGVVLLIVAVTAMIFPFSKFRGSNRALALMCVPQQAILIMSAAAGVRAAFFGHYADGVARGFAFILSDQLATILLAALYTTAVLEASIEATNGHDTH